MKTARIGPSNAAATTGEADPTEDDRRNAEQRVVSRDRCPDAGRPGQRQAAECREESGQGIRDDLRPADGDAAPECGKTVASDRVQGEAGA